MDAIRILVDYMGKFGRTALEVVAHEVKIEGAGAHRFALHNSVDCIGEFTVTHIGTGFAVARGESPDYVIELARTRWTTCDPESLALKLIRAKNNTGLRAARLPGTNGSGVELTRCAAGRDGECAHKQCPQLHDGEPARSGRHCPLDTETED